MKANSTRPTRAVELLSAMVRIDSINPMGRRFEGVRPVERRAIEFIEALFAPHASTATVERQRCSDMHESLIVTVPVQSNDSIALFESHIDTVPVDEWPDRALQPVVADGFLYGRGACDDKGSLVAMILALLEILEEGATPPRTIQLLCAGDEECAQTGIRHFVRNNARDVAFAVFGEPTRLYPVIQHKGTIRWDITIHGKSAHTSRPELGVNAIEQMMQVIARIRDYQEILQSEWSCPFLTGPMITVTTIQGGRTRNAVPDECVIAVDFRILPGMNPELARHALIEYLEAPGRRISHSPVQLMTPPLNTDPNSEICGNVLATCREIVSEEIELRGEPYGTDAAWLGDQCAAIVLGPGDIAFAHAVDERISIRELVDAVEVYKEIMLRPIARPLRESIRPASVDAC